MSDIKINYSALYQGMFEGFTRISWVLNFTLGQGGQPEFSIDFLTGLGNFNWTF